MSEKGHSCKFKGKPQPDPHLHYSIGFLLELTSICHYYSTQYLSAESVHKRQ